MKFFLALSVFLLTFCCFAADLAIVNPILTFDGKKFPVVYSDSSFEIVELAPGEAVCINFEFPIRFYVK